MTIYNFSLLSNKPEKVYPYIEHYVGEFFGTYGFVLEATIDCSSFNNTFMLLNIAILISSVINGLLFSNTKSPIFSTLLYIWKNKKDIGKNTKDFLVDIQKNKKDSCILLGVLALIGVAILLVICIVNSLLFMLGLGIVVNTTSTAMFLYTFLAKVTSIRVVLTIIICSITKEIKIEYMSVSIPSLLLMVTLGWLNFFYIIPCLYPLVLTYYSSLSSFYTNLLIINNLPSFCEILNIIGNGLYDILIKFPMFGRYVGGFFSSLKATNNVYVDSPFRNHITPLVKKVIPIYPFNKISKFTPITFPRMVENHVEVSYLFETHVNNFKLFLSNNSEVIKVYVSDLAFEYCNLTLSLKVGLEDQTTNIKASFKNGCLESYTVESTNVKDSSSYFKPTDKYNFNSKSILPFNSNPLAYLWDFSEKPPIDTNDLTVFMNNSNDNFDNTPIPHDWMGQSYDDSPNSPNNDSVSTFDNHERTNSNINQNNPSNDENPNYGSDLGLNYPLFENSNFGENLEFICPPLDDYNDENNLSYNRSTDYDLTITGENLSEVVEDHRGTKRARTGREEANTAKKVDKGKQRAITPEFLPERPVTSEKPTESEYDSVTSEKPTESEYDSEENFMRDMETAKENSLKEQTATGESSKQSGHSGLESKDITDIKSISDKQLELSNFTSVKVQINDYNIRYRIKKIDTLVTINCDTEMFKLEGDGYLDAILYKIRNALVREYYHMRNKPELEEFLENITANKLVFDPDCSFKEFINRFETKYLKPDSTNADQVDLHSLPIFSTKYFQLNRYFKLLDYTGGLPKDTKTGNFEYNNYMLSSNESFYDEYVLPHILQLKDSSNKTIRYLGKEGNFFIIEKGKTAYFYPIIHECLYSPDANEYIAGLLHAYREVHTNDVLKKHGSTSDATAQTRGLSHLIFIDKANKCIKNKILEIKRRSSQNRLMDEKLIKGFYSDRYVPILRGGILKSVGLFDVNGNLCHKYPNVKDAAGALGCSVDDIDPNKNSSYNNWKVKKIDFYY
jgi:hypothetical protein